MTSTHATNLTFRRLAIACAAALAVTALPAAVAPPAHATPAPHAYAVIGTISVPDDVSELALDTTDDTLYAASFSGHLVATIAPGTVTGTAVSTLGLPVAPARIAVDSDDDTVYISPNSNSPNSASIWITSRARSIDDTIAIGYGFGLLSLGVNSADDTIYASWGAYVADDSFVAINGRNTDDSVRGHNIGWGTYAIGIDQVDDTVWWPGLTSGSLSMVNGRTLQASFVPGVYSSNRDVAVSSVQHVAYSAIGTGGSHAITRSDATGVTASWSSPAYASMSMRGLSLNSSGSLLALTTIGANNSLIILDTATMQPDGAPLSVATVSDVAQSMAGLIYLGHTYAPLISVVASLQGSLSSASAQAGDVLTITLTPTPATAAGHAVVVDDSTLPSVSFGGVSVAAAPAGPNAFTVTVPTGLTGQVDAVATLAGGAPLSLGTVDMGGVTPAPPVPASPPRNVAAAAGDASASVTWSEPESSGAYPVTTYQAVASPGGQQCLASALTCDIGGLSNGTAYSFRARALTGAGWGPWSESSNVVTPRAAIPPSILITGARDGDRLEVAGTTTGLGMGAILTPWSKKPGKEKAQGRDVLVSMEGTFAWSRQASGASAWRVYFTAGAVRSNTLLIPPS